MKTLDFAGINLPIANFISYETDDFSLDKVIELKTLDIPTISLRIEPNTPILLIFTDGTEWITSGADIREIFNTPENWITRNILDQKNSLRKAPTIQYVLFFKSRISQEKNYAYILDQKINPHPGLYMLDRNLKRTKKKINPRAEYLLLIHGEASNTARTFGDLNSNDNPKLAFTKLASCYKDNVLAFEHQTISVSPLENVIDLLEALPDECNLDIIAHSRGGIVADLLVSADFRIPHNEIDTSKEHLFSNIPNFKNKVIRFNNLINKKNIQVNKVVHVGCPMMGTFLLESERADHFFNILRQGHNLSFSKNSSHESAWKNLIFDIINKRKLATNFAGIEPLIPEGYFQHFLNSITNEMPGKLFIIESGSTKSNDQFLVISTLLKNMGYTAPNDLLSHLGSMRGGLTRTKGYRYKKINGKEINHFSYFRDSEVKNALLNVLNNNDAWKSSFKNPHESDADRGVGSGHKEIVDTEGKKITGQRPITLLLPGIMGSHLYADGRKIWMNKLELALGGMQNYLDIHSTKQVQAKSIIREYYGKLVEFLSQTYEVDVLPYDWRQNLTTIALSLERRLTLLMTFGKPIKIIAHSMGGLVVRQLMIDKPSLWNSYINSQGATFLMLGTPWYGSHQIVPVFTGQDSKVKTLAISPKNSKDKLLRVLNQYPSLYQLLPLSQDQELGTQKGWERLKKGIKNGFPLPDTNLLNAAKKNVKHIKNIEDGLFKSNNIYYLAGKASKTIDAVFLSENLFRKSIKYSYTSEGDGRVTWKLGIPNSIPTENVYYTNVNHTDLANKPSVFQGILNILEKGVTAHFSHDPSLVRGSVTASITHESFTRNPIDAERVLLDQPVQDLYDAEEVDHLHVSVVHGDLKMASFPLLFGHFKSEGFINAEKVLDERYDERLSQRFDIRRYPEELGENLILLDNDKSPKGLVIMGLGEVPDLTHSNLQDAVKGAVLEYVLFLKENFNSIVDHSVRCSISALFVGSNSSNLSMESSISAILMGISLANKIIESLDEHIPIIKNVEFIENMDHIAAHGYSTLYQLQHNSTKLKIKLTDKIKPATGRRKGLYYKEDNDVWCTITTKKTTLGEEESDISDLEFRLSTGKARVENEKISLSDDIINKLLDRLMKNAVWKKAYAHTLFELLIPNSFKHILRTRNNILWKMDRASAAFPWESFHDMEVDDEPTFVGAGLIRQFITTEYRDRPEIIRKNIAMVIGNSYEDSNLPTLLKAKEEAELVIDILSKNNFDVTDLIDKEGIKVIEQVMNRRYKILHVSGHGLYEPKQGRVGIELNDGILFRPSLLQQKTVVPEFAFINCCYSGQVMKDSEEYVENRHIFAANIGTKLIEMGAEAVVVAGWQIKETTSFLFAESLYRHLLEGYTFGVAVLKARQVAYAHDYVGNTWAAFQCYGNPHYKLVKKSPSNISSKTYTAEVEILVDLQNLLYATEDKKERNYDTLAEKLETTIEKAKEAGHYTPRVIELVGNTYHALGKIEEAYNTYHSLMTQENADYSVRSLEQYSNLMAKILVRKHKQNPNLVSPAELNRFKAQLGLLATINNTAENLSIHAGGYKRLYLLETVAKEKEKHLERMRDLYQRAYQIAKHGVFKDSIYSLTNWSTGVAITKSSKSQREECMTELNAAFKKLKNDTSANMDFWQGIAPMNVALCQMLFVDTKKSEMLKSLKDIVLNTYAKYWDVAGNKKHLISEIEHLDFLLEQNLNEHVIKELADIQEKLNEKYNEL